MEIVCARALGNTQCNTLTPPHHSPPQYSFALTLIVIAVQLISVQMNRNFNATPLFLQTARFCGFRLNSRARALLLQYVFRSLNFFFVPFSVCFQFLSFFLLHSRINTRSKTQSILLFTEVITKYRTFSLTFRSLN